MSDKNEGINNLVNDPGVSSSKIFQDKLGVIQLREYNIANDPGVSSSESFQEKLVHSVILFERYFFEARDASEWHMTRDSSRVSHIMESIFVSLSFRAIIPQCFYSSSQAYLVHSSNVSAESSFLG